MKTVYTAVPKYLHFAKDHINRYVLEKEFAPITPYYGPFWMLDTVKRQKVRSANKAYIKSADQVWIFGATKGPGEEKVHGLNVTDGVFEEKKLAEELGKKVRTFKVNLENQEIQEAVP
ncbi:MAG: hypothetical protein ACLFRK_02050 [Candidatus Nanohaloarchaea archaeon]